ncbi:MAG: HAD-IB family phosphatase [Muribaculaceae bacterium]|nr:HAD-IB family phosphatase [Muribaculaceae bacterium]
MFVIKAFDFDGTLISRDSFPLFAFHALTPFRLMCGVLRSVPVIARWKLGLINASEAKERIFSRLFKGVSSEKMGKKAELFVPLLDGILSRETRDHLDDDDSCRVIVSASPGFWIRPWAAAHGFIDVLATEAEVVDGRFTGRFSTPNCKGEEKVVRFLEKYPDRKSYILHAWGDSKDDLPLLGLADISHPVGQLRKNMK